MKYQNVLYAIIICTMISLSPINLCSIFAQEMTTIEKYIDENDFQRNPDTFDHVSYRCFALFYLVGSYFLENNPDMKETANKLINLSNIFLNYQSKRKNFNLEYAKSQTQIMIEEYSKRLKKSKALTGNFFDDPVVNSDLSICSKLALKSQH